MREDTPLFSGLTWPTFSMHERNLACACRSCVYEFARWVSSCTGSVRREPMRSERLYRLRNARLELWEAHLFELSANICQLRHVEVGDVDLLWLR